MINAIALDDEPPALELLKRFCNQCGFINLQKCFTRPDEARQWLNSHTADLVFLDIRMPGTSGIAFSKNIPPGTMVIFATAHAEYAVEGFNQQALDYLLKPFTFDRFLQAAEKAKARHHFLQQQPARTPTSISLRVDYSLVQLPLRDILYVEGMDDYIRIFRQDQKPVITRMTMKALEEKLPSNKFARVHKSYIVPVNRICSVRNKTIHINGYAIPVGNSYEERFYQAINHKRSGVSRQAG